MPSVFFSTGGIFVDSDRKKRAFRGFYYGISGEQKQGENKELLELFNKSTDLGVNVFQ